MRQPVIQRSPDVLGGFAGQLGVEVTTAVLTSGGSTSSQPEKTSVKETVTSIVIAFILAFVFRGFVIEAFLIPTGSMAPTLMGAHMRFTGPSTGVTWPVGPQYYPVDERGRPNGNASPLGVQGSRNSPVVVHDPMTSEELQYYDGVPLRSGDRIFVLKYLYSMLGPQRFDVIVFKNPTNPQENYIKRLTGLPGEQVALVDGDVFARDAGPLAAERTPDQNAWTMEGWKIARKPERVQRSVWQPVFDTRYTPVNASKDGRRWFVSPWIGQGAGWQIEDRAAYRYEGTGVGTLVWDGAHRPILDRCPYDETPVTPQIEFFPVSDLRVECEVQPDASGSSVAVHLDARGRQFRAVVTAGEPEAKFALQMRSAPAAGKTEGKAEDKTGDGAEWTTLAEGSAGRALRAGRATSIEFWHADQALTLWVEGERVGHAEYNWSPAQRVEAATGMPLADILKEDARNGRSTGNPLEQSQRYRQPGVKLELAGGTFTINRLQLDRDLFYQPASMHTDRTKPARATHPYSTVSLTKEQFFVCGDNSPSSSDARLWETQDPWVGATITDAAIGVVPRELLVGKAFFVYFPSLQRSLGLPVPDFGRMRFIW